MIPSDAFRCILCDSNRLNEVVVPNNWKGMSSDVQPYRKAYALWVCAQCGHIQKKIDNEWLTVIADIYRNYVIYPLSDGKEQVVYKDGRAVSRSKQLLFEVQKRVMLPDTGKMLDIGCGNGAMLQSFSDLYPNWELAGHELHDIYQETVLRIPRVLNFYTGTLEEIEERFDVITLMHVMEHITTPYEFLEAAKNLLTENGMLLIQVPDYASNPFDLIVVDHASHFTQATLDYMAQRAGFEIVQQASHLLNNKEWTQLLSPVQGNAVAEVDFAEQTNLDDVQNRIRWLSEVLKTGEEVLKGSGGIFGTSTAGTWTQANIAATITCYVDEDPNRQGNQHNGVNVLAPDSLPVDLVVYVALPNTIALPIATNVAERLNRSLGWEGFYPPPLLS